VEHIAVVGCEVIHDVTGARADPALKGLELHLGLRHERREKRRLPERRGAGLGIRVERIEPLVELNARDDTARTRKRGKLPVLREGLDGGLGHQQVVAALQCGWVFFCFDCFFFGFWGVVFVFLFVRKLL
jgi:hypothetical protein